MSALRALPSRSCSAAVPARRSESRGRVAKTGIAGDGKLRRSSRSRNRSVAGSIASRSRPIVPPSSSPRAPVRLASSFFPRPCSAPFFLHGLPFQNFSTRRPRNFQITPPFPQELFKNSSRCCSPRRGEPGDGSGGSRSPAELSERAERLICN